MSRARSLLTRKFRVAISGTIGFWPIDCAFRDQEIEQTSGSPLVAWHAKSVATSFLRLDQETGDAKRHRQVVQPDQGLWVHQADARRQGRVRPYLRGRARRTLNPQRKSGCRIRPRGKSRQVIRGNPEGLLNFAAIRFKRSMATAPGESRGILFL